MSKYIIIKNCEMSTAWYAEKIGYVFKIDKKVIFPNVYTIKLNNKKDRANYGVVSIKDADVFIPTKIEKIKISFGFNRLRLDLQSLREEKLNKII